MDLVVAYKQANQVLWHNMSLFKIVLVTTFTHYVYPGPPQRTWRLLFHIVINMLKFMTDFEVGTPLGDLRKRNDAHYKPPPPEFCVETWRVPESFRERAHELIRHRVWVDLGYFPEMVRDTHWEVAPELKMEIMVPNGGAPDPQQKLLFFVHGGAYMFCSVNSYRDMTSKLSRKTGVQTISVEYRLAPENPFPCALEDVLASYLFLISPPSLSGKGFDAKSMAVCGDSAGGGLLTSLLLLIGNINSIPMPCGALLLSPWVDLTSSMPSYTKNNDGDYIPGPDLINKFDLSEHERSLVKPYTYATKLVASSYPELEEEIVNDRNHFYAKESILHYPLVSPVNGRDFNRFPPIMIVAGEAERLRDEAIMLAYRINKSRIGRHDSTNTVTLQIFEDMPHVFQNFKFLPAASRSMTWCCNFLKRCYSQDLARDAEIYPIDDQITWDPKGPWAWRIDSNLESKPYRHLPDAFPELSEWLR